MFRDRFDAAGRLAERLMKYRGRADALILAIPRGGLEIGCVLSRSLGLPLDVLMIKKIGHPFNPEFAVGSVSLLRSCVSQEALKQYGIPQGYVAGEIRRLRKELKRRYDLYRGGAGPLPLKGRIAIVADDGVATGSTLLAAIELARSEKPEAVVAAVPVAPRCILEALEKAADEVVCLEAPEDFFAVGQYYERFNPVADEEAARLLQEANESLKPAA